MDLPQIGRCGSESRSRSRIATIAAVVSAFACIDLLEDNHKPVAESRCYSLKRFDCGVVVVVLLFTGIIIMGTRAAVKARDTFGCYLALGITSMIALQAIINMGVVMGLLPTKGLPLPFLSYGGTSLLVNLIGVGILISITARGKS